MLDRPQTVDAKDGEMSESLKEHAWKAIRAKHFEQHRNTATRNRFNDFPLRNARWCDAVNSGVRQWFWTSPYTVSTQFALADPRWTPKTGH
jgi:hypothetical protein